MITPLIKIATPPLSKMIPISKEYRKEDIEKENPLTPVPGESVLVDFGKFVKLRQEDYEDLVKNHGKELIQEIIDEMNDYLLSTGKKSYKCYAATIRNWIRRRKINPPKTKNSSNREWLEKVKIKYSHRNDIYFSPEGISFVAGQSQIHMRCDEHGFKEQVINRLRKMSLSIEGL